MNAGLGVEGRWCRVSATMRPAKPPGRLGAPRGRRRETDAPGTGVGPSPVGTSTPPALANFDCARRGHPVVNARPGLAHTRTPGFHLPRRGLPDCRRSDPDRDAPCRRAIRGGSARRSRGAAARAAAGEPSRVDPSRRRARPRQAPPPAPAVSCENAVSGAPAASEEGAGSHVHAR